MGVDPHIAVAGRQHHEAAVSPGEALLSRSEYQGKDAAETPFGGGKLLYAARKHIIERCSGNQVGAASASSAARLERSQRVAVICLTHNMLKIWRRACGVGQ